MKKNIEIQGSILYSKKNLTLNDKRVSYFESSVGSLHDKINSFTRFSSRQNIAKLIAQYKLIEMTNNNLGDVIEAGVYFGSGLMGWANILASLEPYNYQCKVIGFDTFKGSTGVTKFDNNKSIKRREGEYKAEVFEDLKKSIAIFDEDRPLNHLKKIEIFKGDISSTSKKYAKENPQTNIRILHIGMNLYKPTLNTLKNFEKFYSKGTIVSVDGLNHSTGGCMKAVREVFNVKNHQLKTFDFYPNFTYFII